MNRRIGRILGTLGIVATAYWAYALVVVPFVEPSSGRRTSAKLSQDDEAAAHNAYRLQQQQLGFWFREGDWELASPKILETPRGIVLLQDYKNLDDGRVELVPCTMVFLPEGEFADETDRKRRAVVLRAPQGAVLQFNGAFDLRQAKIGKLIGGRLRGPIVITSDQRQPGPDDDLTIRTRDVDVTETRITTPHEVDFRLGPNYGTGRRLSIDIGATAAEGSISAKAANIRSVELAEAVRLMIQSSGGDLFPGGSAEQPAHGDSPQPPIAVTCRGAFRFDVDALAATFVDQVRVERVHASAAPDWLTCERLTIVFESEQPSTAAAEAAQAAGPPRAQVAAAAAPPAAAATASNSSLKIQPRSLEAIGNPVVVEAPTNRMRAIGEHLTYDRVTRSGSLRSANNEVHIFHGEREIHARELYFQSDMLGWLGQFQAIGAGWLRGSLDDDPSQLLEAQWKDSLVFRPHDGMHVLSIAGAGHLASVGRGAIDAEQIHLYFAEEIARSTRPAVPGEEPKKELRPDRMLATTNVRIDSPRLTGAVDRMEAWFEGVQIRGQVTGDREQGTGDREQGTGDAARSRRLGQRPSEPAIEQQVAAPPAPTVDRTFPSGSPPIQNLKSKIQNAHVHHASFAPAPPPPLPSRFRVDGELLQVRLAGVDGGMELREAIIERRVRLSETVGPGVAEAPFLAIGDRVHMVQSSPDDARVTITGAPARVEARGMVLEGAAIDVDRTQNRLWTDGAGRMILPMTRDLNGQPLAAPQPLAVTWTGGMNFDGNDAIFKRDVVARLAAQAIQTDTMRVTMARMVRFADVSSEQAFEVDRVTCSGGVFLENRSFQGPNLASIDRMWTADLVVHQASGDLEAKGPGLVASVRVPTDDAPSGGRGLLALGEQGDAAEKRLPLRYLAVRFQHEIRGNARQKRLTFYDQVRTVYGEVADWNSKIDMDRPERFGPRDLAIETDEMTVLEAPSAPNASGGYELLAIGDTRVEAQTYTAQAARLSYQQSKELLVLDGGERDAHLYRQLYPGAQVDDFAARTIFYNAATGNVSFDGMQALDLHDLRQRK